MLQKSISAPSNLSKLNSNYHNLVISFTSSFAGSSILTILTNTCDHFMARFQCMHQLLPHSMHQVISVERVVCVVKGFMHGHHGERALVGMTACLSTQIHQLQACMVLMLFVLGFSSFSIIKAKSIYVHLCNGTPALVISWKETLVCGSWSQNAMMMAHLSWQ